MLVADTGAEPVQVASDAPPAVGGLPTEGNAGASGTDTPRLPGWIGQLTKDQQTEIQSRVAADPKALEELPKGLTELYAGYSQLKAQSVGALNIPPPDAPKEAWDQFYKGLGRPESAEGYTLTKPDIPSGLRYDENQEKWFRGLAHSLGLNNTQASNLFEQMNNQQLEGIKKAVEGRKKSAEAAITALKQEWKDKYEDNWEKMKQATLQFIPGGSEGPLYKKILQYGLDNDPDFIRMFRNIGDKIGPPKIVVPSGQGSKGDSTTGMRFNVDKYARSS